ncbi:MAG TPA: cysteine rich repeat-containing protein [Rhodopila sp.]|nr:cysteine rich repeat-containing protein [Rhodopila sp.]
MALPPAYARFLSAILLCALAVPAAAQQPSQAQANAIRQNCRSDYQSHCSGVPTGGSAALQCLQQNLASLSPACGSAVSAATGGAAHPQGGASQAPAAASQSHPPMNTAPAASPREEAAMLRRACGGDFRAYCRGVPMGGGRAIGCLEENESRLSPSCRGALSNMHAGR